MQVKHLQSESELPGILPVMGQLRPQYDAAELTAQIRKQLAQGYQLAYVVKDDAVLCVAGFVIADKLAWQHHLYVDDLVTNEDHRSTGAGKMLMDWLKAYAREQGCKQLHLDSGVTRFAAHRFYLREGFSINSHHFAITELD